jgi:hypothetical protein
MVGLLLNNNLEIMWKELAVTNLRYYPGISLED